MGEEEGVGRVEEGMAVGRDEVEEGILEEPGGDVVAPAADDVVANEDVVNLLDAADGGDDGGVDLLVGEGVSGKACGEGGEGLGGGVLVDENDLFRGVGRGRLGLRGVWIFKSGRRRRRKRGRGRGKGADGERERGGGGWDNAAAKGAVADAAALSLGDEGITGGRARARAGGVARVWVWEEKRRREMEGRLERD